MAPAVIDLVSSSPPPSPVACRSSTRPLAAQQPGTAHLDHGNLPPEASQSFDLDAFTSEFNSTGDLDDPFISSPAKHAPILKDAAMSDLSVTAAHDQSNQAATSCRPGKPAVTSLSAEFEIYSDDFQSTIDIGRRTLMESSGNKRRRLSPSSPVADPIPATKAPTISLSSSPVRERCMMPKPATLMDLNSPDPFASSPACIVPITTRPAREQIPRDNSPNPFDSAPISRPIIETQPLPHSSNPFDSTPPTQDTGPQHSKPKSPRPDVFDSSPRQRAPQIGQPQRKVWDPISSSAPEVDTETRRRNTVTASRPGHSNVIDIESSSDGGFDGDGTSDDDLPELNKLTARSAKPRARTGLSRSRSEVIPSNNRSRPVQFKKSTEERERERETKNAAKEADKEKKRIQREKDKAEKAREKAQAAALAEVNKLRTDKKISTPEMLVDLSNSLSAELKTQVETFLEPLDVQYTSWDSLVEGTVKWRRKVSSEFNESLARWEPVPRRIEAEKHVAVVLRADKFVGIALSEDLDDHATKVKSEFPKHHIIYLIEGMAGWFRKNRSKRNRQFTSGVRAQEPTASSSSAPLSTTGNRRRRNPAVEMTEYISEDIVEDALLHLQVMHDVLIHHTNLCLETAQWIVALTQHISTIPYRRQRDEATMGAGFCMESGQVRTGEDAPDTYIKMLQEIARVTAPIAWGVKAEFGSVSELVSGLVNGGPDRLANAKKSANKDGAVSDRTIGQAVSKRLHKVFTSRDENSVDI